MNTIYSCKCGETDRLAFYAYRTYQCRKCTKALVNKGSSKPPLCKCGETDPKKFYKRCRSRCKPCKQADAQAKYMIDSEDETKRRARIQYNLEYQQRNPFPYRLRSAKRRSDEKGWAFNIDEAYLQQLYDLQEGRCYYSGIQFQLGSDTKARRFGLSIDRIDSSKGYVKGNVVLAASIVNSMKNDLTVEDFVSVARSVVLHHDAHSVE